MVSPCLSGLTQSGRRKNATTNELAAAIVKQATTGSSLEPLDKLVCPKCGHRWAAPKSDTAAELRRRVARAAKFLENKRRREIAVARARWGKKQS